MTDEKQRRIDFAHRVRCVFLVFGLRVDDEGLCTDLSAVINTISYGYLRLDASKWAWEVNTISRSYRASDNLYCYCNMSYVLELPEKPNRIVHNRLTLRESMAFGVMTTLVYDFLRGLDSFKPPLYDVETLSTMATLTHLGGE